jgi:hypothetical protein
MSHFLASHKGRTAGLQVSPRAAADDFFNKYADEKKCTVAACSPGPANTVIYTYGKPRMEVTRKTVDTLEGEPLWKLVN